MSNQINTQNEDLAKMMQQMFINLEAMQNQVFARLDDMNRKVETMESTLNVLIEKSGVDIGDFAAQVQSELGNLKLELRNQVTEANNQQQQTQEGEIMNK